MAEPAPEAQPQVPRAPEANVVRDIVVDPALARAAQDTNLQKVMYCPFFCSFSVAFPLCVAVNFGILSYLVSMLVFATFMDFIPYTFALVFTPLEGFCFFVTSWPMLYVATFIKFISCSTLCLSFPSMGRF